MSEVTAEMIERGRGVDPRTATQKRRLGARVRQARERLTTSDTGHRGADIELLRAYIETRSRSAPAAILLILIMGFLAVFWVPAERIAMWMATASGSLFLCYAVVRWLGRQDDARVAVKDWRAKFVATELVHGIVWAGVRGAAGAARRTRTRAPSSSSCCWCRRPSTRWSRRRSRRRSMRRSCRVRSTAVAYLAYVNRDVGETLVTLLALVGRGAGLLLRAGATLSSSFRRKVCSSAPKRTSSSPSSNRRRPIRTRRAGAPKRPISPSRAFSPR